FIKQNILKELGSYNRGNDGGDVIEVRCSVIPELPKLCLIRYLSQRKFAFSYEFIINFDVALNRDGNVPRITLKRRNGVFVCQLISDCVIKRVLIGNCYSSAKVD